MQSVLTLLPLLTFGLAADAPPARKDGAAPVWQTDYATAQRLARAGGRPIFAALH